MSQVYDGEDMEFKAKVKIMSTEWLKGAIDRDQYAGGSKLLIERELERREASRRQEEREKELVALAREANRVAEKASEKAGRSNWIAVLAILIALASLAVAWWEAFKPSP